MSLGIGAWIEALQIPSVFLSYAIDALVCITVHNLDATVKVVETCHHFQLAFRLGPTRPEGSVGQTSTGCNPTAGLGKGTEQ